MANTKSAKKRIRQNARRRERNVRIRTRARGSVRSAVRAVETEPVAEGEQAVKAAVRELDRAASKGVIHSKNAGRRKSRLLKRLKKAQSEKS